MRFLLAFAIKLCSQCLSRVSTIKGIMICFAVLYLYDVKYNFTAKLYVL